MKVRVEELSPIERKLSIEVESGTVSKELDRAYSTLSRQVKIAGFRPGKVPRRILEQRFKEQVEDDVVQRVVQKAYLDAIREHAVEAVGSPQVTNEKLTPDAPFAFEARVEVKPKIQAKDYKALKLTKVPVKVEDTQVDEQITQMQKSLTRLEAVEGRDTAQMGDFVVVDYAATSEGKDFPGNKGENVTMEVAAGELVEGNVAALEGLKIGETRTVEYFFPEDYRVEELRKKPAKFDFTLKTLKAKVEPELNDKFAKETGAGVETLAELKDKVRKDLERAQQQKADTDERDALIKALVEKNPFEVPKAMVERAVEVMLEGALRSIFRSGVDPRNLGLDFERLREEMRPRADSEVRGTLLFESVAEQENIQANDEDIEKKLESLAQESGQPLSTIRKHFKDAEQKRSLALRLREEKTIEFLKSQASYS